MTIDLNSGRSLSDRINYLLDNVPPSEPRRRYLGASVVGHTCERHVQYQYLSALEEIDAPTFPARILRIFDRGHRMEHAAASWLKQAGIAIEEGPKFSIPELNFGGHADGLVVSAPEHLGLATPCLWECKVLGSKGFTKIKKERVRAYSDAYYGQVQLYQANTGYLNPVLYTVVNADTMETWHDTVEYEAHRAEMLMARVKNIVNVTGMGELVPRFTTDFSHYACKFCSFYERCWQ